MYRPLIDRYHQAIILGQPDKAHTIEDEAENLAIRLNGNDRCGIKAGDNSPCNILARATAAPEEIVPLWGQTGNFIIPAYPRKPVPGERR